MKREISDQEFDALVATYRETGDRALRNRLIESRLPMAERLARRFDRRGEPLDDLMQVARLGLLKAVERYDPERGVRFATFAEPTVVGELRRHFRDATWTIRVSRRGQELSREVRLIAETLTAELGRSPQIGEIAHRLNLSVDEVVAALDAGAAYRPASLSAPVGGEDSGGEIEHTLGSLDERLERAPERVAVTDLLARLPQREREILRLRFQEGLSQSEIADRVGVSQMHVSRLLRRTLDDLRQQAH